MTYKCEFDCIDDRHRQVTVILTIHPGSRIAYKSPASSPGANKKFHASHYMKGLHEVVHHIIGAQRGVGYERSG
jgi:hypothetical protein